MYNHRAEGVTKNENVKILWDFNIQMDHLIVHGRPDLLVVNKKESTCDIIDIAEKIENYRELHGEVK